MLNRLRISHLVPLLLIGGTVGLLALGGCGSTPPDTAAPAGDVPSLSPDDEASELEDMISTTGTVRYQELEGGFWSIIARDSTRYDPGGTLPDSLQQEGLQIRFRGEEFPGRPSIRMWGTPIEIHEAMPVDVDVE
ncbi:MAG: hypothetical protein PPP56_06505 [Longimonas sp.]|uniref:hypothetical protein n=1 Tax=Longimonas sp. TaxID=2039626 RepID=UPI003360CFB1